MLSFELEDCINCLSKEMKLKSVETHSEMFTPRTPKWLSNAENISGFYYCVKPNTCHT